MYLFHSWSGPDFVLLLVCALQPPNTRIGSDGFMARVPSHTYRWPRQVLLSNSNCFLSAPNLNHQCRGPTKRPRSDDGSPHYHCGSYDGELLD